MPVVILLSIMLLCSCSFSYEHTDDSVSSQPDIVFFDVTLCRYTEARRDLKVDAHILEMYDNEKIWAGKKIAFTQYDEKKQTESLKGSTVLLYIDEKQQEYSLGEDVFFHILEDNFKVNSRALIWKKKEDTLAAPADETVTIIQGDDITVEGKGFAANTAAKTFSFDRHTTGTIVIKDNKTDTGHN